MDIHYGYLLFFIIGIFFYNTEYYLFTEGIFIYLIYGYPLPNVLAWISVIGYQCGYPRLYE